MLKHILLGFLNYRPMTGYELKSLMDESTMHFWHAYHSQIYTTLRKLEEQGLVTSELEEGDDKLNRRTYTITDSGRADLRQWLDTPLTDIDTVKEGLLVRTFFSGERGKEDVADELRFQKQLHQRKLEQYQRLTEAHIEAIMPADAERAAQQIPFWSATLHFGIEYEKMYLNWLDTTLQIIEATG
jgi:PadR family transcriptional regulator AphA